VTSNATVDQLKRLGWTTGVNLDISMHDADIGRKMKAGRVDLVAMNPYSIAAFAQQSEIALSELQPVLLLTREGGYFLGLNLDTPPEVRQRLERAMRQMRDDGSLDAIARRWRAPLSHRLAN
jgi:polar amino acid transport system substrate-binding protein